MARMHGLLASFLLFSLPDPNTIHNLNVQVENDDKIPIRPGVNSSSEWFQDSEPKKKKNTKIGNLSKIVEKWPKSNFIKMA